VVGSTRRSSRSACGAPPEAFAGPLVLRVLGAQDPGARALREAVTQNTVASLGYPAPRTLLATADQSVLGGAFLIMERLSGEPLTKAGLFSVRRILLEMQLRLHALDADACFKRSPVRISPRWRQVAPRWTGRR
jgi:aminoglycoside phosphotransferase (APT) family kinase protein